MQISLLKHSFSPQNVNKEFYNLNQIRDEILSIQLHLHSSAPIASSFYLRKWLIEIRLTAGWSIFLVTETGAHCLLSCTSHSVEGGLDWLGAGTRLKYIRQVTAPPDTETPPPPPRHWEISIIQPRCHTALLAILSSVIGSAWQILKLFTTTECFVLILTSSIPVVICFLESFDDFLKHQISSWISWVLWFA